MSTQEIAGTTAATRPGRARVPVIDCDVHTNLPNGTLERYLPRAWARHYERYGLRRPGEVGNFSTRPRAYAARADSFPPSGAPPGGDLEFMQAQLLDTWDIERAVINPMGQALFAGETGEYAAALVRAVNDWTAEEWLAHDPRLLGSICVPSEDAALAAEEVHRRAEDPRFVQVLLNLRTREPMGTRKYRPIFEAATEHGLPVAAHVGGPPLNPYTPAGWPSYYLEYHGGYPQVAQSQIVSLVCEGVFERLPTLQVVFQEAALAWIPPLMWRLDRAWRRMHDEVPELTREPSSYIRDHFYFTTQPIEEPAKPEHFDELMRQLDMEDRLLFASDYPHWDFDAPDQALPRSIASHARTKIMSENARALYRLSDQSGEAPEPRT